MFLRSKSRYKNGKQHRYFSVVENRRLAGGGVSQRQVLYLGEINDTQEDAWRRTLDVFDEERQCTCQMSLFPDDLPIPADAAIPITSPMAEKYMTNEDIHRRPKKGIARVLGGAVRRWTGHRP